MLAFSPEPQTSTKYYLRAPACALKPANAFFYSSLAASLEMRSSVPAAERGGLVAAFPSSYLSVWSPPPLVHTMALPLMKKLSLCMLSK